MSQHDYVLDNAGGAAFRSDLNAALLALASMNSGATAPTTPYAYQLWADTTANILKQRNASNSAWLEIGDLNVASLGILSRIVANLNFKLDNATPAKVEIGRVEPFISTLTAGSETGGLRLHSKIAGVLSKLLEVADILRTYGTVEHVLLDNGAGEGPDVDLFRDSASPAASDILGALRYKFRDSANNVEVGSKIVATLLDPTNTSEDVALEFHTIVAGALAKRLDVRSGLIAGAATGGDMGAGTINSKGFYVDGVAIGGGAFSLPVSAKTATYNMVAGDKGAEINFTTAGVTLNLLAAATAGNGATIVVRNSASSGDVTIDPSGSETLDGQTTRLLRPNDVVMLRCDGSTWVTVSGAYSFESSELSITASTSHSAAHGLGAKPTLSTAYLRCKTAEGNWSVNDEVQIDGNYSTDGWALSSDATNIRLIFPAGVNIGNKTGATFAPTLGNWRIVLRCRDSKG